MLSYWKLHRFPILMIFISVLFYSTFAYDLQRTDFIKLAALFTGLFILCFKLIQFEKWNFKLLFIAGILFRLAFLFAEPNLSQDFYRFIWDGELLLNGINPYLLTPNMLIGQQDLAISNAQELYQGMGSLSARHFSNYPPLNQVIFALAALLSGKSIFGSIVVMRMFVILGDVGILYFGRKLLKNINRSDYLIFWYFLNPLIIIELTGNLHFEGVMLFFFVWSLYLFSKNQWYFAAVIYACSISVKLVPLIFLPLFLNYFGLKKSVLFYLLVGLTTLLIFLPFFSMEFYGNYSKTIGLWFSNFEFNASLYNVIKKIALQFDVKGYELIKTYGKIFPWIIISSIFLITFLRDNKKLSVLITSMLYVLAMYYFMATTVHPWYIIFLVLLSIFTEFQFTLLWSLVVILSYWAYTDVDYKENLALLSIEYIAVYGFLIYEILKLNVLKVPIQKN